MFVGEAQRAQALDAFAHPAARVQLAFALPVIVADAEAFGRAPLAGDDFVAPGRRKIRQPRFFGFGHPTVAVALADLLREGDQIIAGIAVLRKREIRLEELTVTGVERTPERVELAAGVVDDPLDEDVVAAQTHRICQCRADDIERPCTTTSGPVGLALPNSSETRGAVGRAFAEADRRRPGPEPRCPPPGRTRRLMKPPTGSICEKSVVSCGASLAASATIARAISCGDRRAAFANEKATLVAKSPNSGRRGASNATGAAES